MCGRFNLTRPADVERRFGFLDWHERRVQPRFNIAPTQPILILFQSGTGPRSATYARWGLDVSRSQTPTAKRRPPPINARAESLATNPVFRAARRCLIPATGFFEWQAGRPMHIQLREGQLFAFAGLWLPGATPSAAIVTTRPNTLVSPIHDRMPAILRPDDEPHWLDGAPANLLLQPYPADGMRAYAVGPGVNKWENDDPSVLDAAPEAPVTTVPRTLPLWEA
jgi:putative SOS response-associated peptidase YedK